MEHHRLERMVKGWFVGDFAPVALQTADCEVAVKAYSAGDVEDCHYHRVATEVTVIVSGEVEMVGRIWRAGDIVVLAPGEATGFKALSDTLTVVVKTPSVKDDKFITDAVASPS